MNKQEIIEFISEAKDIHVTWMNYADAADLCGCDECILSVEIAGDYAWHEKWVNKYQAILDYLESI